MLRKVLDSKYFQIPYKILKTIFVIVIILYLSFVIVQRISGNKSILGYRIFTVATGSMIPVYNINDVLAIKAVNVDELEVGDDITYLGNKLDVNGKIVTHRIIKVLEENGKKKYVTKGVNSETEDPVITENQIYGKVIGIMPVINTINHIVKNQYGFFFCIFLPLVVVIFLEIADTVTEIKREKKRVEANDIKNEEEVI